MDLSKPRLIYPLLDGFLLGDAVSEHDGVRCYPAIRQKTGEKYIVKVISVPSSRVQLDALLLTGAFSGKDGALAYFKDLAKDLLTDCQTLMQLSHQEGFVAYEDSQLISSEDGNGYEVYLLSSFKPTLEREFAAYAMTHRGVLDLALDLCAALAACRRAGYIYVDLKPSNVFCSETHGCRIGDLGFVSLSSLQFTPLQNQYRSRYTSPEMADAMAVIEPTMDIYALGTILYQACNGGVLPAEEQMHLPPLYADYALSEIIRKACAEDPAQRWQDPTQMAQALISYMHENIVTDDPMIPPPIEEEAVPTEEFLPEASPEELEAEMGLLPSDEFLKALAAEEIQVSEEDVAAVDVDQMLAQADDLIAHELPEPPVAPQPIEVPMPPLAMPEEESEIPAEPETEPETEFQEEPAPTEPEQLPAEDPAEAAEEVVAPPQEAESPVPRRPFPWRPILAIVAVLLLLFAGYQGKRYYDQVYVQQINELDITLDEYTATVKVVSDVDEALLTVICSDSYGNAQHASVTAGIAVFTDLQPQTRYTIRVEIAKGYKLTGITTDSFTTPAQTQVLTFTACIGDQDASVDLSLTSSGPAVELWTVTYVCEGAEAKSITFSGNTVTIPNLQVGKEYTFTLSADGQVLGGVTQVRYKASNIIVAENLVITDCGGGSLTVQWDIPGDEVFTAGWAVHCYDGAGFDETVITYEPWYTFKGMDHTTACTVEVTASGMFKSASTTIQAHPVKISGFEFRVTAEQGLIVRWSFAGNAPDSGWIVEYTIDSVPYRLVTQEPSANLSLLPGGSYEIRILAADDSPVFSGQTSYVLSEVGAFQGYGVSAYQLTAQLQLPQVILTMEGDAAVETTEASIEILYILRDSSGALLDVNTQTVAWNSLWQENRCVLTIPDLPADAGVYRLSIYFGGGLITEQELIIE